MTGLHLLPKHNYHICGDHNMEYALWLIGQLPDSYAYFIGPEELYKKAIEKYPTKDYRTTVSADVSSKHKLLVMYHTDVESTIMLHDSVQDGDILYTLQDGDTYDYMVGIDLVDSEDELLHNMHISCGDIKEYLMPVMESYGDVATFLFYDKGCTSYGSGEKIIYVFPADCLEEIIKYRNEFERDIVWTYSKEVITAPGPNVRLNHAHAIRYSEGEVE